MKIKINGQTLATVALAALFTLALTGCQKSESEQVGKKLGAAVRGAAEDVKTGADKVAQEVDKAAKTAVEGTRDFGKGVKEGWKSGEK